MAFLRHFCVNCTFHLVDHCFSLWREAKSDDDVFQYTSCVRAVMGERNLFVADDGASWAVLLTDWGQMWARDGWMTGEQWAPSDFILHAWKATRPDWSPPLVESEEWRRQDMATMCQSETEAHLFWPYKDSFMSSDEWVRDNMQARRVSMKLKFLTRMRKIFDPRLEE